MTVLHPLQSGVLLPSPGGHFTYRVIGPCCRLFDREQLPWPCCRLQWRGKEPSWRRIGRRFTPDLAAQRAPSYAVEILDPGHIGETMILTLYNECMSQPLRDWWYSKRKKLAQASVLPPSSGEESGRSEADFASALADRQTENKEQNTSRVIQCVLPLSSVLDKQS